VTPSGIKPACSAVPQPTPLPGTPSSLEEEEEEEGGGGGGGEEEAEEEE